jgi:hypothetical protein
MSAQICTTFESHRSVYNAPKSPTASPIVEDADNTNKYFELIFEK